MTNSKKPHFDFVTEKEVEQPDFLSSPYTSNHIRPKTEAQLKKIAPHTVASLFSCCCSLPGDHKNKTNSFPACFSKTGLKTAVSPVKKSCTKLYNVPKRPKEMSNVATA